MLKPFFETSTIQSSHQPLTFNNMKEEKLDIYNERMEHIGSVPRKEAHQKGNWHKAFHCWIVSEDELGKQFLLFQLRSKEKESVPNSLDISAAGHLKTGESPIDGLRELKEELGIEVKENDLKSLGIHVEVYCDAKSINREFDHVYLLKYDQDITEYEVQPSEVTGLTKVLIEDGIKLFSKKVDSISAHSVHFDELGKAIDKGFKQTLKISSFAGGERNNYFIKIFLLAQRFFKGENLLYI